MQPKNWLAEMNPHPQFSTEEFLRYGAECQRMARHARSVAAKPKPGVKPGPAQWVELFWTRHAIASGALKMQHAPIRR